MFTVSNQYALRAGGLQPSASPHRRAYAAPLAASLRAPDCLALKQQPQHAERFGSRISRSAAALITTVAALLIGAPAANQLLQGTATRVQGGQPVITVSANRADAEALAWPAGAQVGPVFFDTATDPLAGTGDDNELKGFINSVIRPDRDGDDKDENVVVNLKMTIPGAEGIIQKVRLAFDTMFGHPGEPEDSYLRTQNQKYEMVGVRITDANGNLMTDPRYGVMTGPNGEQYTFYMPDDGEWDPEKAGSGNGYASMRDLLLELAPGEYDVEMESVYHDNEDLLGEGQGIQSVCARLRAALQELPPTPPPDTATPPPTEPATPPPTEPATPPPTEPATPPPSAIATGTPTRPPGKPPKNLPPKTQATTNPLPITTPTTGGAANGLPKDQNGAP